MLSISLYVKKCGASSLFFSGQKIKSHNHKAQNNEHHAGGTVQSLRFCLVGEDCCDPCPDQGEDHTEEKDQPVGRAADHEMGDRSGEGGKSHDENAGAHSSFELIAQDAGEDEEHHHTAAGSDETADEADYYAADHGLDGPFFRGNAGHGFLGGHDRAEDEFNAQKESHKDGKAAHGLGGNKACDVASHCRKDQDAGHHDEAVPDVQIFVFVIGVGGNGARQHVGGQGDAHGHVGVHIQKSDEHGADDCGGAHAREAGAEACAHAGKKSNQDGQ